MKALIVFEDTVERPWQRLLKRGFRHCFVIMNNGQHWLSIEAGIDRMDVALCEAPASYDLAEWFVKAGHKVIEVEVKHTGKCFPVMPFTCVELVKRIVGIQKCLVITPWQLYKYCIGK